ncbi:unnamed protein product [Moneuplotes crassus]|uniref:RING-type domain-containing protein n=1 Tax=Euplotes crassus TaxID=5936 RepID=A0AAD1XKY1_EUPCR|nr:unnamed protein product [Moneuplotes crassus]
METFTTHSALTKSELQKRRQEEINSAWGGMSLGDAIASAPARETPNSMQSNSHGPRAMRRGEAGISIPNGSSIEAQMDQLNEKSRLEENLLHNYDHIGEPTALEEEYDQYIRENEEVKDPFDEEEKDPDTEYWEQMHQSYQLRQDRSSRVPRVDEINPSTLLSDYNQDQRAFPVPDNRTNPISSVSRSRGLVDNRQISGNSNGYNMNFIDWNNEAEAVMEALESDDPDEEYIRGLRNRDLQQLYDSLVGNEEEEEVKDGVKEDIMKKFKIVTIRSKKEYSKDDTCPICLSNYGYGHKIIKLPCKHFFHEKCVKEWFSKKSSCPKCRKDLNE